MKLYDYLPSGNSYKVRLLLSWLGQSYTHIPVDIHKGETRTAAYLAMNPSGQMPLLVLDDGRVLPESGAILFYLATGTRYLPSDKFERAQVMRWMLYEQNQHEPWVAGARFVTMYKPERAGELPALQERGHGALQVLETHLSDREYFVGDRLSIADIALFAYTHVAPEGGIDLSPYKAIRAWIDLVQAHPNHISITKAPNG